MTVTSGIKSPIRVSIVIPVFNEQESIPYLHQALSALAADIEESCEVIFVNDGSQDNSWLMLNQLQFVNYTAVLINLSRNFGKEAAVQAGFDQCTGDVVVQLDADLQDPPELIPKMLDAYYSGADVVNMKRAKRNGESWLKTLSSKIYYRLLNTISEVDIPVDVGDFRLLSRRVVEQINGLPERNRYMKGIMSWPGFNQVTLDFERPERVAGTTGWSVFKLFGLALDGISSFSDKPLRLAFWAGLAIGMSTVFYALWVLMKTLFLGNAVDGYPSLFITQLLLGSLQLLSLGVLGEYLSKVYRESKARPLYIVMDKKTLSSATVISSIKEAS